MIMATLPKRSSTLVQKGFVLVTALMFLVVVTILGISIMGTNTLNERMTGYFIDRQMALQAAEAALRDAERDILYSGRISGTTGFSSGCATDPTSITNGLCLPEVSTTTTIPPAADNGGKPIWVALEDREADNGGWLRGVDGVGPSVQFGKYTDDPSTILPTSLAALPRYFIEVFTMKETAGGSLKVGFAPQQSIIIYRVTAVGFGRQNTTRVVLQALYKP
jgi:type IV pilus assembly protein PilX